MTDLRNNVLPFGRVLEPDQLSRIFADQPNLYDSLEERARIAEAAAASRRIVRKLRAQSFVKWGSLVVALVTVIYFAGQLVRGAF